MRILKTIPAYLLAFLFIFSSINFFYPIVPTPKLSGKTLTFFNLFGDSGYMAVVKVFEIIGSLLILIPSKRALATLILTPIAVNILLFEVLVVGTPGIGVAVIAMLVYVIYQEKDKFKALI